ncbi:hypothetical protein [Archangium violaceum]|jgi:hypothetical protein|uniref:hypothetical protein n=1 Tax=Archangium violaceum TaxID=83451 RepID=UPI0036DD6E9B
MANRRSRQGKAAELQVVGLLTDAGLDCYLTVVDDQGIDAVIRVDTAGAPRYFDVQVKSARSWAAIRGSIAALGKRKNAVLVLFNSTSREVLWLDSAAISSRFSATGSTWGDVFLTAAMVQKFRDQGRADLSRLREHLEK